MCQSPDAVGSSMNYWWSPGDLLGSRSVRGEKMVGVLSWTWQRLVINPSAPCMVSTLLLTCWQVPTVKSCLKQKRIAGKVYAHRPQRSFPDTGSEVMSGKEEKMLRVLAPRSSLKHPAAESKCLPSSKCSQQNCTEARMSWKECPCPWLGSHRSRAWDKT